MTHADTFQDQDQSRKILFIYLLCDYKQTTALVIISLERPKYSNHGLLNSQMRLTIWKLPEMALVTSEKACLACVHSTK